MSSPIPAEAVALAAAQEQGRIDGFALLREHHARYLHDPAFHHGVDRAAASARALSRLEGREDTVRLAAGIALILEGRERHGTEPFDPDAAGLCEHELGRDEHGATVLCARPRGHASFRHDPYDRTTGQLRTVRR